MIPLLNLLRSALDYPDAVELLVTDTDLLSVHQNLGKMENIVAEELNELCEDDSELCCSILGNHG